MTEQEIVDNANELARRFAAINGYSAPDGFQFYDSKNPEHYRRYWQMTVAAYEYLIATDVEDCLTEFLEA